MRLSHFFVDRPIFAAVLSAILFIVGAISLFQLPISEYPEVVPPTVVVRASYPGASPTVVSETVAAPLEQAINGVEGMLYMSSQATADGTMMLTVTFKLGTDLDKAQVQVQNRVAQALPKLPDDVRRLGVLTEKSSPDLTMVVHLYSPAERYDPVYLANYALLQVRDSLARIPGTGQVLVWGAGEYGMRVWLDPEKVASRGLTASDVVRAIREQNVQVAAGAVGQTPAPREQALQLSINAQGRLADEEQFGEIVIKAGPDGQITRLRDVARVELGAAQYALRSLLDNKPAVAVGIFQAPGSNALELSDSVRATMEELKADFPEGVDYRIVYDPTQFVRESIRAVVKTLLEAVALVVIVVILFLQTWRASIIPLLAVPVSIVGTFAVLLALGYSINALSLFGLVLAIGIVVDDAIVVVENVERHIRNGLGPREATKRAMTEVTGPIVATALVLCAVFIPTAFVSGLSGQFYKQFAVTIAISTVISAINSLTLSPALSAVLLRPHDAPKDIVTRFQDRYLRWLFGPFNRWFERSSRGYVGVVAKVLRGSTIALALYVGLIGLTWLGFASVPSGFLPQQDKQYLVAFAQLPAGATLDRTDEVVRRMSEIALDTPGVQSAVAFPGLSINGFTTSSSAGVLFVTLDPFGERRTPETSALAIAGAINQRFAAIQEAFVAVFPPPPVLGLGALGGFKLQIEDRADRGLDALNEAKERVVAAAHQTPGLAGVFSGFDVKVPQLDADIDRVKAKQQGVALTDVFETMQVYLGSLYVNDFNRFGRTYRVIAQADSPYRLNPEDIGRLRTRNGAGEMVPLGALVTVRETAGPDLVTRYNGYLAADINGGPAPGVSSGQAQALIEGVLQRELPRGMSYEWTDLTYQQILAGNSAVFVFPLAVLLVFLVLAAQYESWSLPLAVILIVPLCLLSAIGGVWLTSGDNNIFTQIGFIVLIGLASKNAILIVEFARSLQDAGVDRRSAVLEACRLRLRPILMTSIAFIMGVVPLVAASGAGAEMRHAMGIAVFFGMLGVTAFGLLLTPVFYDAIRAYVERRAERAAARAAAQPTGGAGV
ncbi:transporter [Sulfurifustis variabilis]|uniref:Efflux pump membrane transporter n=1 Tax=Sulfurifustis variabilis TaxID=1675686 RepID=A0A1C7AFX1_9GAMM|nr:efflux RND transporter permease subunit [Sulfurifustis variabilis]BAU50320.1 transporter [Sulfurifustis variabilis]